MNEQHQLGRANNLGDFFPRILKRNSAARALEVAHLQDSSSTRHTRWWQRSSSFGRCAPSTRVPRTARGARVQQRARLRRRELCACVVTGAMRDADGRACRIRVLRAMRCFMTLVHILEFNLIGIYIGAHFVI